MVSTASETDDCCDFACYEDEGCACDGCKRSRYGWYWEIASEGLGTSYAGGWAVDPAGGAAANPPITSAWGVPLYSDALWPSAYAGTGLLIDKTEVTLYVGQDYRIDVSNEAGNRFDQNVTGFRAEEEFGFNAEPYVRTGRVQKIIGI